MRVAPLAATAQQAQGLADLAAAVCALEGAFRTAGLRILDPDDARACAPETIAGIQERAIKVAKEEGFIVVTPGIVDATIAKALKNPSIPAGPAVSEGDGGETGMSGGVQTLLEMRMAEVRDTIEHDLPRLRAEVAVLSSWMSAQQKHADLAQESLSKLRDSLDKAHTTATDHDLDLHRVRAEIADVRESILAAKAEASARSDSVLWSTKEDSRRLYEEMRGLHQAAQVDIDGLRRLAISCDNSATFSAQRFARLETELRLLMAKMRAPQTDEEYWFEAQEMLGEDARSSVVEGALATPAAAADLNSTAGSQAAQEREEEESGSGSPSPVSRRSRAVSFMAQVPRQASNRSRIGSDLPMQSSRSSRIGGWLEETRNQVFRAVEEATVGLKVQAASLELDFRNRLQEMQAQADRHTDHIEGLRREVSAASDLARTLAPASHLDALGARLEEVQQLREQMLQGQAQASALHSTRWELEATREELQGTMRQLLQEHDSRSIHERAQLAARIGDSEELCKQVVEDARRALAEELRREDDNLKGYLERAAEATAAAQAKQLHEFREELLTQKATSAEAQSNTVLHMERLHTDAAQLRIDLTNQVAQAVQQSKDEVDMLARSAEAKSRIEVIELRAVMDATVEKIREDSHRLIASTREASLAAVDQARTEAAEARAQLLSDTRADVLHLRNELTTKIGVLADDLAALDRRMSGVARAAEKRLADTEGAFQDALVGKDMEIRAQGETIGRVKRALGSLAQGMRHIAAICGILPPTTSAAGAGSELDFEALLNWELSGQSVARRVEDAWAALAPGQQSLLELCGHTAEQAARRLFKTEVGDMEARIQRTCQALALNPHSWVNTAQTVAGTGLEAARAAGAANRREMATPRSLAKGGQMLVASGATGGVARQIEDWPRTPSGAMAPIPPPRMGATLAELRASTELRAAMALGASA